MPDSMRSENTGFYFIRINHSDPEFEVVQVRNAVFDLLASEPLSNQAFFEGLVTGSEQQQQLLQLLHSAPCGRIIPFNP